ncbi:hypothetical protein [Litorilituus lipolyticus]|uniref:Uncharacterized protein n=1 Tax=Litorilituus lipolyticus TaxID=2491017 RepID=A0A502L308_9GAMM|nr:hypothetical protein [Litorilituus lipolyticus]TPH18116.1 hypothetical protein EPA86_03095 [Litorilituus lipolyticus]
MTLKLLKPALLTSLIGASVAMSFMTSVNATVEDKSNYKIYVHKNCQKLKEIPMTPKQIEALKAFEEVERSFEHLEKPLEVMEAKLEQYEEEFDKYSDEIVIETDEKIVINKSMLNKHEAIAEKMELIMQEHELDMQKLEQHADIIDAAADKFDAIINESLGEYKDKDVTISIGKLDNNWRCNS